MLRKLLTSLLVCLLCVAAGADTYIEDSGVVRRATRITDEDAGTVRTIQRVFIEDAGAQRLVFAFLRIPRTGLISFTQANPAATATAGVRFDLDGNEYSIRTSGTTNEGAWGGGGSGYEVRATLTGGTTPTTNAGLGTWLNLGTSRTWSNFNNTAGTTISSTLLIELGIAGTSTALASGTITIEAEVSL